MYLPLLYRRYARNAKQQLAYRNQLVIRVISVLMHVTVRYHCHISSPITTCTIQISYNMVIQPTKFNRLPESLYKRKSLRHKQGVTVE